MEPERIANTNVTFQDNRKTQIPWMREVHQDLVKCGIREKHIGSRDMFRRKISDLKDLNEQNPSTKGRVLYEEERARARQRMNAYWQRRNELQREDVLSQIIDRKGKLLLLLLLLLLHSRDTDLILSSCFRPLHWSVLQWSP